MLPDKKRLRLELERRRFLGSAALLALGTPVQACVSGQLAPHGAGSTQPSSERAGSDKWGAVKREFDLDYSYAHFGGFLIACHPRIVRDEIERYRKSLQRNPVLSLSERELREEEVRASAAQYLGVEKEQIALTASTCMGLALVYNGIPLRPGAEVLTTVHDHYATQEALKFRADKDGTIIRTIPLFKRARDATTQEILESLTAHLNDKTRLVALTWVHSGTGIKLPIAEIGAMLEDVNRKRAPGEHVLFCVDGVHGLGVENVTFDELKCDYFIAGTHKWMFGPRGTGIICSRSPKMDSLVPTVASFSSYDNFGTTMTHGGFHAFEHQWALKKAFEFHLELGKAAVTSRIHTLNAYLKQRLEEVPRVELVTPESTELSAGFTFFKLRGAAPEVVEKTLWDEHVIVSSADRDEGPIVRMAPGLLNDEAEIDRTIAVLKRKFS